MRPNINRQPKRNVNIPIKSIDIFQQPKPTTFVDLGYVMSVSAPLQDPCAYGSSMAGVHQSIRPANRITECLAPTYEETETSSKSQKRSTEKDPAFKLALHHDLKAYKESMTITGTSMAEHRVRNLSRSTELLDAAHGTSDSTFLGDVTSTKMPPSSTMLVTPIRRSYNGPHGSTAKRQRTTLQNEGDVSLDTVRSVLKMIDDSLMDTPERITMVTPKVSKAVPGPSPREHGPTYAYSSGSQYANYGGLTPKSTTTLAPFSIERI